MADLAAMEGLQRKPHAVMNMFTGEVTGPRKRSGILLGRLVCQSASQPRLSLRLTGTQRLQCSTRIGRAASRCAWVRQWAFRSTIRRPPCTSLRCAAWGLENELDVFTVQLPSLWRNGNVPMVTWEVWPSKGTRPDVVALSRSAD
jgi:hypothetical protein